MSPNSSTGSSIGSPISRSNSSASVAIEVIDFEKAIQEVKDDPLAKQLFEFPNDNLSFTYKPKDRRTAKPVEVVSSQG